MKLVVIYGPPAVGKLTVARELSKLTGYKVLHNHLAIDLVESVFDRNSQKFWELIDHYRLQLVDVAGKEKISGMIMTSVNIKGQDDLFISNLKETVEGNSGTVHFVRLSCGIDKLRERLVEPSRAKHGKLVDVGLFDDFVSKHQVFEPIESVDSLSIDNTDVPASEAAKRIVEHYRL
ncbi:MAG: AAA family ATPase [Candidatus Micrarchaeota archaeon]|nr:AAA family ATPase [Candidatus Micrarchaeota archaeon]